MWAALQGSHHKPLFTYSGLTQTPKQHQIEVSLLWSCKLLQLLSKSPITCKFLILLLVPTTQMELVALEPFKQHFTKQESETQNTLDHRYNWQANSQMPKVTKLHKAISCYSTRVSLFGAYVWPIRAIKKPILSMTWLGLQFDCGSHSMSTRPKTAITFSPKTPGLRNLHFCVDFYSYTISSHSHCNLLELAT